MSESGVAALGGSAMGWLGQHLYDRWLRLRSFLIGLRIAWVSSASAVIGLLLFFGAAPAQDILLEVNYDDVWSNLFSWVWFYGLVIFFWALPVFVSARWILTRFEEGSDRRPTTEPVSARVRNLVPAFLAALCFVAVLMGQLMALRVAPPLGDNARQFIEEAEKTVRDGKQLREGIGACARSLNDSTRKRNDSICAALVSNVSIVVGSRMVRRSNVPILALGIGLFLAFWLYLARPTTLSRLLTVQAARRSALAVATCIAIAMGYALVALAAYSLFALSLPLLLIPSVLVIPAVIWLAWLGRERLLWWLGTFFGIVGALVVVFAIYGVIEVERKATFGLAHLHLLPFATAVAAAVAWWGLSRQSSGQATRIGQLLLRLTGTRGAHSDQVATARLVNPIFYGLVVITVALNVLFIVLDPLDVTEPWRLDRLWRVNRSSLLPIVLGLPVAVLTWLTYGSARLRVPLVLVILACLVGWNMLRAALWEDYYAVRALELSTPRLTLNDAVEQWAKANDCRLPKTPGSAAPKAEPQKEECRAPIIVAAAGGASRAAFHLVGVVGKLLDGEKFSPLGGHKGIVYSAAFNHDGSLIVTASLDNTARIWDGKTGALVKVLDRRAGGHNGRVQSAAFSRDGKRLVTASWDRTARVWDVSDRANIKVLAVLHHVRDVNSAAFSGDGKLVVTGSDDGKGRIWDWETETRRPRAELMPAHKNYVYGVAFSPDGKRVVTASWDRTAKIWDVSNLDQVIPLQTLQHMSDVNSAAFSPDSKLVVTGADDGKARVWDVEKGDKKADLLPGHEKLIHGVAFSPDGKRVVTASWDRTARIWDVSNLNEVKPPRELKGHDKDVNSAAFSPDGRLIVTASDDKTARIWDVASGKRATWEADTGQFRPFGKQLFAISAVSGGALGAAVIYATLADSQRKPGDAKGPPCNKDGLKDQDWFAAQAEQLEPSKDPEISWKACLQLLVAGDFLSPVVLGLTRDPLPVGQEDRATLLERAWEERYRRYTRDPAKSKGDAERPTLAKGLASVRRDAGDGWLPILLLNGTSVEDGRRIITSDVDMSVLPGEAIGRVFQDAYDFHKLRPSPDVKGHNLPVYGVAATADGARIVTASKDGTARIWEVKTGALIAVLDQQAGGHRARVQGAAFSPDGKRLVTASWDRTAKVWDVSSPEKLKVLAVLSHDHDVNSAAFSPDGKLVATGSDDGKVRIWDAQTGTRRADLRSAHRNYVYAVAFSPDGKRLVSASWDRTAKIWDVSNPSEIRELKTLAHGSDVNSAAFSPDGKLIVTGADDGKARIWDAETGDRRAELPDHQKLVYGVAFSPDGKRVATASWDRTAKIWDVSNLSEIKELRTLAHGSDVNSVAFIGPDGKLIVTGADDGKARIFDADTGRARWTPCADCEIGLSTAVTMSARFPVVSPAGTFVDRDGKTRRVVDGGYYENFGATAAMELARVLRRYYGLYPSVILVNNEHTVTGLEGCVTRDQPVDAAASWLWSPLNTVIGTRTARGSHATVSLCEEVGEGSFAFFTVAPDKTNEHMTLSVSWWMSKNVQSYLDRQLTDDINRPAFRAIDRMRQKPGPRPVSLLETMKAVDR